MIPQAFTYHQNIIDVYNTMVLITAREDKQVPARQYISSPLALRDVFPASINCTLLGL